MFKMVALVFEIFSLLLKMSSFVYEIFSLLLKVSTLVFEMFSYMFEMLAIENIHTLVVFAAVALFHLQAEKPAAKKRKLPEEVKKKAEKKKKKEEKTSRKEEKVSKKEVKVSKKEEKSSKKEKPVKHVGVYSGVRKIRYLSVVTVRDWTLYGMKSFHIIGKESIERRVIVNFGIFSDPQSLLRPPELVNFLPCPIFPIPINVFYIVTLFLFLFSFFRNFMRITYISMQ